jgi:hypothetical protein
VSLPSRAADEAAVRLEPVASRPTRRDFLDVPGIVYADDPNWIAPLRLVERHRIGRAHPFYEHGEGAFWVAYRGGRPAGRIGATVNRLYLERQATGAFTMLEAVDDRQVFAVLLGAAEGWLRARGMGRVIGPLNLSTNEEVGLLVEGFDTPPFVWMGHGRPYYAARLAECGYAKVKDLLAFIGEASARPEARRLERLRRLAGSAGVIVRTSTRRRLARDLRLMFEVYNDGWADNWGFVPMTEREIAENVRLLWFLLPPQGLVIAEREGRALGVVVVLANINEGLVGARGRLFPFAWARLLLWRLRIAFPASARVILGGIRREAQRTPVGSTLPLLLLDALRPAQHRFGIERLEGSWVLETNSAIIKYCELAGFRRYKTYRIFGRRM